MSILTFFYKPHSLITHRSTINRQYSCYILLSNFVVGCGIITNPLSYSQDSQSNVTHQTSPFPDCWQVKTYLHMQYDNELSARIWL